MLFCSNANRNAKAKLFQNFFVTWSWSFGKKQWLGTIKTTRKINKKIQFFKDNWSINNPMQIQMAVFFQTCRDFVLSGLIKVSKWKMFRLVVSTEGINCKINMMKFIRQIFSSRFYTFAPTWKQVFKYLNRFFFILLVLSDLILLDLRWLGVTWLG